jgi:hypothetical protein
VKRFVLLAALLVGCGGAAKSVEPRVAEADRARMAEADAQALAPQAWAEGDQALKAAKEAEKAGDQDAADLYAERALAAYQHAVVIARLARATDEQTKAQDELAKKNEEAQRFAAARKSAEREADDLDKQLKIAREAMTPATSGPADAAREKARLTAALSLATQARLLCGAARLVSAQAPGLAEAEAAATDLEKKLDAGPKPAPIDAASRVRAACLNALTKARRTGTSDADAADTLLGELTKATDAKSDTLPSRDERGVVVTLHSIFKGTDLTSEGTTQLKELGRVAAAHPKLAVQVVIHDATPPSAAESTLDTKHGEAAAKALGEGGATKTKVEQAGARNPIVDPTDTKRRDKNARVEVVFVGS